MGRQSLHRLTREADFRLVYRNGSRRTTDVLVVHVLFTQESTVRLGLAVGRRFGHAVSRNRFRRRVREAVRAYRPAFVRGCDLVVVPAARARQASFIEIRGAVGRALITAGCLADTEDPPR